MRNGTRSNKLRLVDNSVSTIGETGEAVADQDARSSGDWGWLVRADREGGVSSILILFTMSVACATAAVAAGSYALWLTRHRSAHKTLTDVQDILKVCQERMWQMENDLNHLPSSLNTAIT